MARPCTWRLTQRESCFLIPSRRRASSVAIQIGRGSASDRGKLPRCEELRNLGAVKRGEIMNIVRTLKKTTLNKLVVGTAVMALAAGSTVPIGGTGAVAANKVTISVAYAADTTFDTTPLGLTWWTAVKKEFEAKYPNVTVNLVAIHGGEPDFLTKLALLYHNSSTAPTLTQFPSTEIALYQSSGYLMAMDSLLKGS